MIKTNLSNTRYEFQDFFVCIIHEVYKHVRGEHNQKKNNDQ